MPEPPAVVSSLDDVAMMGESVEQSRRHLRTAAIFFIALAATGAQAEASDLTSVALTRCLADPAKASTAGQADCEAVATRAYDLRMNSAYAALTKRLPSDAERQLRQAQRAWLAFRDAEAHARGALYASRQGTMYVPMEAASATRTTRDRALELEAYLRVMAIEQ